MTLLLRNLLSIALLPFVGTVVVPTWIASRNHSSLRLGEGWRSVAIQSAAALVTVLGLALFVWSLERFARQGRGTLAPWDPPRAFVATGPYRYLRNPMISGVIAILLGEAIAMSSLPHLEWAATFFVTNAIYFRLFEEPQLARRFGAPYAEYCRNVPRFVPRLHPWRG